MVAKLQTIHNQKDNEIQFPQDRVEDLERYTHKENSINSGLKMKNTFYACNPANRATAASTDSVSEEEINTLDKHCDFLFNNKLPTGIKAVDISACHNSKYYR